MLTLLHSSRGIGADAKSHLHYSPRASLFRENSPAVVRSCQSARGANYAKLRYGQKPPLLVERTAVKSTTPPPHLPAWSTKGISPRVRTALSRNADSALSNAALSIEPLEISSTRSRWLLPVVGAVIGAGAGAVWGTYLMNDADEWIAPPAHLVTIPIGAAAGALVGWVADQVVRR